MNKTLLIFIFIMALCTPCFAQYNETLTIATYYPSPNGIYRTLRLNPSTQPASGVAGDMYYDVARDTPMYRDATAPAQWNSFISEYGHVNITAGQSYITKNFRKTYTTPPIVIPVGNQHDTLTDNTVMVFLHDVTNNNVVFDVDCVDAAYNNNDTCAQNIEVQYIVIPR